MPQIIYYEGPFEEHSKDPNGLHAALPPKPVAAMQCCVVRMVHEGVTWTNHLMLER